MPQWCFTPCCCYKRKYQNQGKQIITSGIIELFQIKKLLLKLPFYIHFAVFKFNTYSNCAPQPYRFNSYHRTFYFCLLVTFFFHWSTFSFNFRRSHQLTHPQTKYFLALTMSKSQGYIFNDKKLFVTVIESQLQPISNNMRQNSVKYLVRPISLSFICGGLSTYPSMSADIS